MLRLLDNCKVAKTMNMTRKTTHLLFFLLFIFFVATTATTTTIVDIASEPYAFRHDDSHGSSKSFAELEQMMQPKILTRSVKEKTKQQTYEVHDLAKTDADTTNKANIVTQQIGKRLGNQLVNGHLFTLENSRNHFSVYEPMKGCGNGTNLVRDTARYRNCKVATNAGFFNTHSLVCLGNLVSDGKMVQVPGTTNVNFGITMDGKIVVGYLRKEQILGVGATDIVTPGDPVAPGQFQFTQLIAGVIWLVREGRTYVQESELQEDMNTQETGSAFSTIRAGRVALAHDRQGRIMIFQMDGDRNFDKGVTLREMADMLVSFGAVNAINLDGGGSTTAVMEGNAVNFVSDGCPNSNENYRCERAVTTITCMHDLTAEKEQPQTPAKEQPMAPPSKPQMKEDLSTIEIIDRVCNCVYYLTYLNSSPLWQPFWVEFSVLSSLSMYY